FVCVGFVVGAFVGLVCGGLWLWWVCCVWWLGWGGLCGGGWWWGWWCGFVWCVCWGGWFWGWVWWVGAGFAVFGAGALVVVVAVGFRCGGWVGGVRAGFF
ncbi:hypothetical protein, partial [Pseudomonas syringae group genomosp. 7]|uniref:hypothetical protein n=1 Tax=Pseudomonas syringae group genomosp. 7 TaxID=251699 RepID=UPI00376FBB51